MLLASQIGFIKGINIYLKIFLTNLTLTLTLTLTSVEFGCALISIDGQTYYKLSWARPWSRGKYFPINSLYLKSLIFYYRISLEEKQFSKWNTLYYFLYVDNLYNYEKER